MSQAAFERIANKYPGFKSEIYRLEVYLSQQLSDVPIRGEKAADFIGIKPDIVETFLENLVNEYIVEKKLCLLCHKPRSSVLQINTLDLNQKFIA